MTGNPANAGSAQNAGYAPEVPRTRLSAPVRVAAVIRGGEREGVFLVGVNPNYTEKYMADQNETTAEQAPQKKGIPDWVWWIVIPVCFLGGGALGAFMAQALWLRILLGLAGALVLGFTGLMCCLLFDDVEDRNLAIVFCVLAVIGAAIGVFLGHALWQRAVFGLAGCLVLALVEFIVWCIIDDLASYNRIPCWVMMLVTVVFIVGGGTLGAFMAQALWLKILLGLAGALVLGFTSVMYCLLSDIAEDRNLTIVMDALAIPGAAIGAFLGRALWQRAVFGLAGALALTLVAYIAGKIMRWKEKSQWIERLKLLSVEEKRDCWEKTESFKKGEYWNLLSAEDKMVFWQILTPEQQDDYWPWYDNEDNKAFWSILAPEQKIEFWTRKVEANGTYSISQSLSLHSLLSPDEKDTLWSMLTPEQKYDVWSKMDGEDQKAYFPKLPFDTRMEIVTQKADVDVNREDAESDAALKNQKEFEKAYDGAFAVDLFMNFDPGAGYGLFDSVESAKQKYEYLYGIAEYCSAVCNCSIAIMRYNAALYARYRAQAVVYCQAITEISSRLSVKEREAFDTAAINDARQVKEIQFSGKLPAIAVQTDYAFGSTIEGLFSGMSKREKKQLGKSVSSTFQNMSAENRGKAMLATVAVGAALEIGASILHNVNQALEAKRQYKEAEAQLIPQINAIVKQKQQAANTADRLWELKESIDKSIEVYQKIFSDVNDALYPTDDPSKSREARAMREKLGSPYFTMDEKQKVMELAQVAGYMMKIVDAGI
jgi:hypothetical protein